MGLDPSFIETARDLWNSSQLSAREIANKLGVTKNVIAGMAWRYGFNPRGDKSASEDELAEKRRVSLERKQAGKQPELSSSASLEQKVTKHKSAPAPVKRDPPPAPVRLGCQFPLWPHLPGVPTHKYCDKAREGISPYCADHFRRCYVDRRQIQGDEHGAPT